MWRTPSAAVKSTLGGLGGLLRDERVDAPRWPRYTRNTGPVWAFERLDVAHAVVLLVGPRQLVLLDDALEVILATGGGDQPGLAVRGP